MEHDLTFTYKDDVFAILPASAKVLHKLAQDATAAVDERQKRQVRGEV